MSSFYNSWTVYFTSSPEKVEKFSVIEVNINEYVFPDIVDREDCLILHQVQLTVTQWDYNIVLLKQLPNQQDTTFSLYRSDDLDEALSYFNQLKPILPVLLQTCPHAVTLASLPKICEYIRINSTQNIFHICARFGYCEYLKKPFDQSDDQIDRSTILLKVNHQDDEGKTPLHIAIESQQSLAVTAILQLKPQLDLIDNEGNTVIHYAAKTTRLILTEVCTACSRELESTILYFELLDKINFNGQSALHVACVLERIDCAKELIRLGANLHGAVLGANSLYFSLNPSQLEQTAEQAASFVTMMYYTDAKAIKDGGTPLHWSTTAKVIHQWLELKCNVNALNLKSNTALHMAIERQDLASVIALLSNGAHVNECNSDGNSPLHLAVINASNGSSFFSIIQAVLVFGANVNAVNYEGQTVRHLAAISVAKSPAKDLILYLLHSVGAARCTVIDNCTEGCSPDSEYNGTPPVLSSEVRNSAMYDALLIEPIVKHALKVIADMKMTGENDQMKQSKMKHFKLLSLDGGGIRGLIMIQMLAYLEEISGQTIVELFDWVAGTSTGGILALLLASGYPVSECRQIYFRFKDEIFIGSKPHPSEKLETFLQKYLGTEKRMNQFESELQERGLTFRVMVPVTCVDYFPPELKMFRTYAGPNELSGLPWKDEPHPELNSHQELVWKVGRATGAAPTFFSKFDIFLDGGLISNNPTLDLLSEVQNMKQIHQQLGDQLIDIDLVVSFGTGLTPREPFNALQNACLTSYSGISDMWHLIRVLAEQTAQTDGQIVERAQAWCSSMAVPYFRLNPPLSECYQLNETDNAKLVNMLWQTMAYLHRNEDRILQLVALLKA